MKGFLNSSAQVFFCDVGVVEDEFTFVCHCPINGDQSSEKKAVETIVGNIKKWDTGQKEKESRFHDCSPISQRHKSSINAELFGHATLVT